MPWQARALPSSCTTAAIVGVIKCGLSCRALLFLARKIFQQGTSERLSSEDEYGVLTEESTKISSQVGKMNALCNVSVKIIKLRK